MKKIQLNKHSCNSSESSRTPTQTGQLGNCLKWHKNWKRDHRPPTPQMKIKQQSWAILADMDKTVILSAALGFDQQPWRTVSERSKGRRTSLHPSKYSSGAVCIHTGGEMDVINLILESPFSAVLTNEAGRPASCIRRTWFFQRQKHQW